MHVQTALIETHSACQKSAICRTDGATCGIVPITPNGICANLRDLWENKKHPERLRARHI